MGVKTISASRRFLQRVHNGAHFKTRASKFLAGLVTAIYIFLVLFCTGWIVLPRTERQLRQTSRTSLPSQGMKGYEDIRRV